MRYLLTVTASAAVTFLLVHSSNAVDEKLIYERGYKDGAAQQLRANADNVCTAWFFDTNLKAAKARMCGKRH